MVILTNPDGIEECIIKDYSIDIDLNETMDFELEVPTRYYDKIYAYKGRVFVPNTEYGGILGGKKIVTSGERITISGRTWRGYLDKHIIRPDSGQDYKIVSGELNYIIRQLINEEGIDTLFRVTSESTEVYVENYRFGRYVSFLKGIEALCNDNGQRLDIKYVEDEDGDVAGFVDLSAVQIMDYSSTIEVSQDSNLEFTFTENIDGVNHLICLGQNSLSERDVLDLYVQEDGTIGTEQFYFGMEEIAEVYDYPNAESAEELRRAGIERFKEVISKKTVSVDINIESLEIDIGDIIGGRDYVTGAVLSKPVVNKIYTETNGVGKVEYKISGDGVLGADISTLKVYSYSGSVVRGYLPKIVNNIFPEQVTFSYVTLDGGEFIYRPDRTAIVYANTNAPALAHKYYGRVEQLVPQGTTFSEGHFEIWHNVDKNNESMVFADFTDTPDDGQWHATSKILELTKIESTKNWMIRSYSLNGTNQVKRRNHLIIDLTSSFGEGNEPDVEWCDANIPYLIKTATVYKTVNFVWSGEYYTGYFDEYGTWRITSTKDGVTLEKEIVIDKPDEYELSFLED